MISTRMFRAVTNWLVAVALLVAPLSACGSSGQPGDPANPVDGTIVAILGDELTLETVEGERHVFTIADPSVSVEHLHEHRIQELPVRISWLREGERLLATTIADAP